MLSVRFQTDAVNINSLVSSAAQGWSSAASDVAQGTSQASDGYSSVPMTSASSEPPLRTYLFFLTPSDDQRACDGQGTQP